MTGIFLNYRRDDVRGVAGRLYDHLTVKFSKDEVFMDVDAMKPGMDFVRQLDTSVSQCHVFLAMIGPNWLDAKDRDGRRRLDDSGDFVRVELASALKREIPVIPVLIDGAEMPPEARLPDDLKPLARRHALELRHTRFNSDADTIVGVLEKFSPPARHMPSRLIGAGIAAAAAVIAAVILGPTLIAALRPAPAPPTNSAIAPLAQTPQQQTATNQAQPPPAVVSSNIAGTWSGTYYYDANSNKPVAFTFYFDATGNGRSEEDNTFGEKSAPKLFATLKSSASSLAAGEDITITKTYDGTGGVSHAVTYIGSVSADLKSIFGRWETANWRGNFTASR
jgi:TIR domain